MKGGWIRIGTFWWMMLMHDDRHEVWGKCVLMRNASWFLFHCEVACRCETSSTCGTDEDALVLASGQSLRLGSNRELSPCEYLLYPL